MVEDARVLIATADRTGFPVGVSAANPLELISAVWHALKMKGSKNMDIRYLALITRKLSIPLAKELFTAVCKYSIIDGDTDIYGRTCSTINST